MEPWMIGGIVGMAVATGTIISQRRGAKTGDLEVLPVLRARGPMTVPELMRATGLTGFSGQGKIVMALSSLVQTKQVIEHPVPDGTPMREKIKLRRYEARA